MTIQLPQKVSSLLDTLRKAGYEAYAVGGCVRDSILGRKPDDWDITTSARPAQVKALFPRTADTGIRHGTVTVLLGGEGFEVTTYRIDGEYEDGRHPKAVAFTSSLEEDLRRRDFTINAMAYHPAEGLVDLFDGLGDLRRGWIRAVGDPAQRFQEDALRMMRAVRFAAQLGYEIEPQTRQAIAALAPTIERISAERIQTELTKLLVSPHPELLEILYDTGVTKVVLPEFDRMMETPQHNPHHCYSVGGHTLHALREAEPDRVLRLAVLFHDVGKPATRTTDAQGVDHFYGHARAGAALCQAILRRLKWDNGTIGQVSRIVRCHDDPIGADAAAVRRFLNRTGEDIFPWVMRVKRADVLAQSDFQRERKLEDLALWQRLYDGIRAQGQCVSLKDLAIGGSDLIALGIPPGRRLGETLQSLLDIVLEDPGQNTRERLLERAEEMSRRF